MGKSRSATRTIRILELVASEPKGLTLSEISNDLEIPITSANDIIKSLVDMEMLDLIDERSKVYGIGVKAFYIGNAFIQNTSLIDKAKPIAEELGDTLNKTVFIGKQVKDKITYLYKYEPLEPVVATCEIGSQANLHSTALGKSILAFDQAVLDRIDRQTLTKKTINTITSHDVLHADLERVRARGFAIDNRETNEHLFCIGAPIFDSSGKVIAALSISGLYSPDLDVEKESDLVRESAKAISVKMGWQAQSGS